MICLFFPDNAHLNSDFIRPMKKKKFGHYGYVQIFIKKLLIIIKNFMKVRKDAM
jgi:hypothetical protein